MNSPYQDNPKLSFALGVALLLPVALAGIAAAWLDPRACAVGFVMVAILIVLWAAKQ